MVSLVLVLVLGSLEIPVLAARGTTIINKLTQGQPGRGSLAHSQGTGDIIVKVGAG